MLALDDGGGGGGGDTNDEKTFEWSSSTEFEGRRVAELKKKASRPPPSLQERVAAAGRNLVAQGPRGLLIVFFVLLTLADVFFNMSRGFICSLPELCEPAVALGDSVGGG